MRHKLTIILSSGAALVTACTPAPENEPEQSAAPVVEVPTETVKVAPNESLIRVTCADFLISAEVATTQPVDDAALAAQDELANGLTWLHGYLYATSGGKIEKLSQDWMATTAKRVFEACSAAERPAETSLFEVAVS